MSIFEQHPIQVQGTVEPGYESVGDAFREHMSRFAETCAQLCVYKGPDRVVDMWAAPRNNTSFTSGSLVNVFSSGKSLESVVVAWLFDRGLLDFNAKIADYWPEYGQAGKEETTVADLMRHEAGLSAFNTSLEPDDLLPHKIKENRIGQLIEKHPPAWRGEDSPREYHGLTRGWIVNEVVRRVDAQGRTIGEIIRQEIQEPMGLDIYVGLQEAELERRSPLVAIAPGRHIREAMKPTFMGRGVRHNFFQLAGNLLPMVTRMRSSTGAKMPIPYVGMNGVECFNERAIAMGETSSANAHCSARGLGKLASMLACGGASGNERVLSDEACAAMHAEPIRSHMGMVTTFTQGGVASFGDLSDSPSAVEIGLNTGRDGFYGWMGLGGSVFQWHPEKQIGFAFVPTRLHVLDFVNERGKLLQQAVLDAA